MQSVSFVVVSYRQEGGLLEMDGSGILESIMQHTDLWMVDVHGAIIYKAQVSTDLDTQHVRRNISSVIG